MNRKQFVKTITILPFAGYFMKLNALNPFVDQFGQTEKMPVLFLGHGSPMNAIEENEFVIGFREIGKKLPRPNAIICVSAHWETRGTFVTAMEKPKTIHDFGGFPESLYSIQYPAPGSPELAHLTKETLASTQIGLDYNWGLDHGCWSVVKHLFPKADIPVIQLSLDKNQPSLYHYQLAKELFSLRTKGILIIGSGNMVHNLGMVSWDKLNDDEYGYDWAIEASSKMKNAILADDHNFLIDYSKQGKAFNLAIPTPEHFLPLLYTLALKDNKDLVTLFNDKAIGGSLTMTSVKIG